MPIRTIVRMVITTLLIAAFAQPAQAGTLNGIMRWFGWGWSDGYHSGRQPMHKSNGYYCPPDFEDSLESGYPMLAPAIVSGRPSSRVGSVLPSQGGQARKPLADLPLRESTATAPR